MDLKIIIYIIAFVLFMVGSLATSLGIEWDVRVGVIFGMIFIVSGFIALTFAMAPLIWSHQ